MPGMKKVEDDVCSSLLLQRGDVSRSFVVTNFGTREDNSEPSVDAWLIVIEVCEEHDEPCLCRRRRRCWDENDDSSIVMRICDSLSFVVTVGNESTL